VKRFLLKLGLTVVGLIIVFVLALLWHQNKPKPPFEIRRDLNGITVVFPNEDD
jgi:hypothetical protein